MTDYEDLHAVVITTPVVHLLHDVAPGEDRPSFLDLVQDLLADPWRILQLRVGPRPRGKAEPVVQAHEAVAAGLSGVSWGPAMYPSTDIDM
jgi:hypothetical protein